MSGASVVHFRHWLGGVAKPVCKPPGLTAHTTTSSRPEKITCQQCRAILGLAAKKVGLTAG